jgi:hypothetical protein
MKTTSPFPRVDLYTTIHKGIRALLFDVTAAAARLDASRDEDVDDLVDRVERLLRFLDEHAEHEDAEVLPAVRRVAPAIEAGLAADHRALDGLQQQVGIAAEALAVADGDERPALAADLCRRLNQLTAAHLSHMHREETEANPALWAGFGDEELLAIQLRIIGDIAPDRFEEWMTFVLPALSPAERAQMAGGHG